MCHNNMEHFLALKQHTASLRGICFIGPKRLFRERDMEVVDLGDRKAMDGASNVISELGYF